LEPEADMGGSSLYSFYLKIKEDTLLLFNWSMVKDIAFWLLIRVGWIVAILLVGSRYIKFCPSLLISNLGGFISENQSTAFPFMSLHDNAIDRAILAIKSIIIL
jgi:hypothetical protein